MLTEILEVSLAALVLKPEDQAARELALILAEQIDFARANNNGRTVADLSSKLTTLLTELLMTPKSRQAIKEVVKEVAEHDDESARILHELQTGQYV